MLDLGIPLGCPKTYLKDVGVVNIGRWTYGECIKANESPGSNQWPEDVIREVARIGWFVNDHYLLDDYGIGVEMEDAWPNYTVGCYMLEDLRLRSPRNVSWYINEVKERPSVAGLARLYHELSLLLPINPIDEIRNRLENVLEPGQRYHVAELTGRDKYYVYSHAERQWRVESKPGPVMKGKWCCIMKYI